MKLVIAISFVLSAAILQAQAFWSETFNNGCLAACSGIGFNGGNGAWSQSITGAEGANPNCWFVSCAENGMPVGSCGSGCGSNATMHISAQIGNPICPNDCGAAYDAGGLCGLLTCPQTNRRIQSPTINCTGHSGITMTFNYIEGGQGTTDNFTVWYFDGATWSQIDDPPKTAVGCGGQGIWATRSVPLPASANNNASVKIGLRWVNNDDGLGNDPSVAVNDLTLSVAVLPIDLMAFNINSAGNEIDLSWLVSNSYHFKGFSVERSEDGSRFSEIAFIKAEGDDRKEESFSYQDRQISDNRNYFYRLRCVNNDGSYTFSETLTAALLRARHFSASFNGSCINVKFNNEPVQGGRLELLDVSGKTVLARNLAAGENVQLINAEDLDRGIYFVRFVSGNENQTAKVSVW